MTLLVALLVAQLHLGDERLLANAAQMSGDVQASGCHGHLLAAWHDGANVVAVVDGHAITVSASTRGTPAVACGADSWLVVWPSQDFGVDGRRVAFDGTLFAPLTIFRGPFGAADVAATFGGGEFLVAWADGVTIRALRLSGAGTVLDAQPIAVAPVGDFAAPRALWTGAEFYVAWAQTSPNPFLVSPVQLWGTRVSLQGLADPVLAPTVADVTGSGAARPSVTAAGEQITFAWVAQHGIQTCVDMAKAGGAVRRIRCSGDGAGDGIPVFDQAQILLSRGEQVLVWRELMPDLSSILRAMRVDVDVPPYATLSKHGWAPGLTATPEGVAAVYFSTLPPPEDTAAGVFVRVIEQATPPARRHAVDH